MLNKQRDKHNIIDYKSSILKEYEVMSYEWIDNLCFTIDPHDCLDDADDYLEIVKNKFLDAGWYGDGKIELMWIPPFMFNFKSDGNFTKGKVIWHVKQKEDGISWILHEKGFFNEVIKMEG